MFSLNRCGERHYWFTTCISIAKLCADLFQDTFKDNDGRKELENDTAVLAQFGISIEHVGFRRGFNMF